MYRDSHGFLHPNPKIMSIFSRVNPWSKTGVSRVNPPLFGESFLWARIFYNVCGEIDTRADDLLRVRKIYYACGYLYDLMLCKKIVILF